MSLLTTAQLTFCDLKDSYSIHLDTECIGLACDNSGLVSKQQSVTINYRAFTGSTLIEASCEVFDLPNGVTLISNTSSSSNGDGSIVLNIDKGASLNNEVTSSAKFIFTTLDNDEFTFERYITFVKSIAGYDGTDAVNFQIYSVNGFEFNDTLTSIELKTAAFQGGSAITTGATYQCYWWNNGSTEIDKYELISEAVSSTLIVNISDPYALASLKCAMRYDNIDYEDHVVLTKQSEIYTAMAKFFKGNNVIKNDEEYMIVYVELYKNNTLEESIYTDKVYISDENSVEDNIITTDLQRTDEDIVYFVCKQTYNEVEEYNVVLGQYTSDKWQVVTNVYAYHNDLFSYTTSNVVFIPKEKIPRSLNIGFEVYNDSAVVARTNAIILDLNDPMISNLPPANPKEGQLWLDTSVSPSLLRMWDGIEWIKSGYQDGNVVYTSQPINGYSEGDLWILSKLDEEIFNNKFSEGTMLKATTSSTDFDVLHWIDVDEEGTNQKNNIKLYFTFNVDTGLRIGQASDKFYVNIDSTEMGFYDASSGTAQKVVSISNQSAKIKNLTVEEGAIFNCEVQFGNFILKTEENGSLSLALK